MKVFCRPMERHYITKASANAAMALSMAKELQRDNGVNEPGVQELVHVIDCAARGLIQLCRTRAAELSRD